MAILDKQGIFSENQAVTNTAISQNVIILPETGTVSRDTAQLTRNLGAGETLPLLIQVTEDFATLTSLTIELVTADNAALSTNATTLYSTGAIPVAKLKAGYKTSLGGLPDATLQDYLGMRYTVTGTNASAGKVTAALGSTSSTNWL